MNDIKTKLDRDIDIGTYLSTLDMGYFEVQEIVKTHNVEFNKFWKETNKIFFNTFILTADDEGLKRFEYYTKTSQNGTLEERRQRVLKKWNEKVKYTNLSIFKVLNLLLGKGNYQLNLNKGDYEVDLEDEKNRGFIFTIEIRDDGKINEYEFYNFLDRILPLNLVIELMVDFLKSIELETTYTEDAYPLVFCGEIECGTYPEYEDNQTLIDYANADIYQQDFNSDDIYILGGA